MDSESLLCPLSGVIMSPVGPIDLGHYNKKNTRSEFISISIHNLGYSLCLVGQSLHP